MKGTLTIYPNQVDMEVDQFSLRQGHERRLKIDGIEVGSLTSEKSGATLIRCMGMGSEHGHQDFLVRLSDHGERLAMINYEPHVRTDEELRVAIADRVALSCGDDLDSICRILGLPVR